MMMDMDDVMYGNDDMEGDELQVHLFSNIIHVEVNLSM
jgi:hypothetical protein